VRSLTGNSVTIFLYTVFMLLERGRIFRKINLLNSDEDTRRAVNETIGDMARLVREYITVKTVVNLIVATISYFIMLFVGVDFAGFWALLIFLFNFIPIVGAISAISLPVILSLVQPEGGGVQTALLALALLVGTEQAMSSGIEPRLIGRSLNLSPLVILLSLAVWGSLWGFAGMLLAVPITVTIMIILTQFESTRPIAILLSDNGEIAPIKHAPIAWKSAA
jgi:predicted PurR-regulated permease PerM